MSKLILLLRHLEVRSFNILLSLLETFEIICEGCKHGSDFFFTVLYQVTFLKHWKVASQVF